MRRIFGALVLAAAVGLAGCANPPVELKLVGGRKVECPGGIQSIKAIVRCYKDAQNPFNYEDFHAGMVMGYTYR